MTIEVLDKRRNELGLTNKSLAIRLTELLLKSSGKSFSLETMEPRVSRLFTRHSDGVTFFRKHPRELAEALALSDEDVTAALNAPILLLDPAVPAAVADTLIERKGTLGTFEVLRVTDVLEQAPSAARDALREAAKRSSAACVVLESAADEAFYEGAGLQCSRYERTARGIRILAMPELVPDPPLKPARRRQGRYVLVPDPDLATSAKESRAAVIALANHRPSSWSETNPVYWLERAEAAGEEPSFPLEQALPSLRRRVGDEELRVRDGWTQLGLDDLRGKSPTVIWEYHGRYLVTGRAARAVEEAIDDPDIRGPGPDMARQLDDIERGNPFREQALARLTQLLADKNLNAERLLDDWRDELIGKPGGCHVFAVDPEADRAARELLSTIAQREWRDVNAPLRLRAAARAELIVLAPVGRRDVLHVVANMGAGRLLRVRVLRFECEAVPLAPFEPKRDSWRSEPLRYDGGDVHIVMSTLYDEMLEGERLVPRERRREEEARAAED